MSVAKLRGLPLQSLDTADLVAAILELADRCDEIDGKADRIELEEVYDAIREFRGDLGKHVNTLLTHGAHK